MKVSGLDRDFFQLIFSKLYQERWKSAGKSQEAFAAEVRSKTGYSYTKQTISDWLHGKKLPSKEALKSICEILKTEESAFQPLSYGFVAMRYSPDHADWKNETIARTAKKDFGIDLRFFECLRNIIPDFETRFPLNSPLIYEGYDLEGSYQREAHKEASKTGKEKRLFQIERNKKAILLTEWDLRIIRILQNNVIKCVCDWMEKISAEMIAAEKTVNLEFLRRNPLTDYFDKNKEPDELTEDELQKIDRYGLYTDEIREKYNPEAGKVFTLEELEQLIALEDGGKKDGKH